MKTIIVFTAFVVLVTFGMRTHAQSATALLQKYCMVSNSEAWSAERILIDAGPYRTPNIYASTITSDINGSLFVNRIMVEYDQFHDVPLANVANDLWVLISPQLSGEPGALTLTMANIIPTTYGGLPMLVITMWDERYAKWRISAVSIFDISGTKKGGKIFSTIPKPNKLL